MPIFSISCESQELTLSGFDISFGKSVGGERQDGNILAILIIIPSAALFIFSFFIKSFIKETKRIILFKTACLIVPVFNIFAIFVMKTIARAVILQNTAELGAGSFAVNWLRNNMNIKYGFVLYIIFNAVVFIFACVNYFVKRE